MKLQTFLIVGLAMSMTACTKEDQADPEFLAHMHRHAEYPDRLFAPGTERPTFLTRSAVDNTPEHACGYGIGYVVHSARLCASRIRAPNP